VGKSVGEDDARRSHLVHRRGLKVGRAVTAEPVRPQGVDRDEEEIRPRLGGFLAFKPDARIRRVRAEPILATPRVTEIMSAAPD